MLVLLLLLMLDVEIVLRVVWLVLVGFDVIVEELLVVGKAVDEEILSETVVGSADGASEVSETSSLDIVEVMTSEVSEVGRDTAPGASVVPGESAASDSTACLFFNVEVANPL